ncbi:MAG: CRISPR-associated helicase Cas3' [Rhodocyclaceae bacterium]|nr:CRISPR-associated helicase Cas3' [Rhodocyclaceae bacterium]
MTTKTYFRYWGKASPELANGPAFHLLPYHCLDVAATGLCLLRQRSFGLESLGKAGGLSPEQLFLLQTFFKANHDLGKFARGFQNLVPNLSPALAPAINRFAYGGDIRHDTLGWIAWQCGVADALANSKLPKASHSAWGQWFLAMAGHHGEPPREIFKGSHPITSLKGCYFHDDDLIAAAEFSRDVANLLLPDDLPAPNASFKKTVKAHSWRLAGLTVLADWIGSSQSFFPYHSEAIPLADYWRGYALPQADRAVAACGLGLAPIRDFTGAADLFDYLHEPTPLQNFAAATPLENGPQLFVLEDVTGAGKTEAALILAHRLMAQGQGSGLYFGLPSMATSNQMYRRVGDVFRRFFAEGAHPSLVLAHGARHLVEEFESSILPPQPDDLDYGNEEPSAGGACAAWLADSNKKALLAEVGVGTLDQALLAIMPARHQSLRLLGLAGKVLILDEVHAFDAYTGRLLQILLEAHARQGGSAILLSATLPAELRADLVASFQRGLGIPADGSPEGDPLTTPYPLATWAGQNVHTQAVATRPQVKRRLPVRFIHDEEAVHRLIRAAVEAGQCVCWIRNTVDDARDAWSALREADWIERERLMLFHSRYTLSDRLEIENAALDAFGKTSGAGIRHGRVLIATQVVEQSVDIDADVLISDLAPIDLLIQRAGRLHRHLRDAQGNSAATDSRPEPVLYVFAPEFEDEPKADWHSRLFRRAAYVYPDTGRLWLTQKVLREQEAIRMPEGARLLIESVYGLEADSQIPAELLDATDRQMGKALGDYSLARTNALQLDMGYCRDSGSWDAEEKTPTRLGDDDREFILLRITAGGLKPWAGGHAHPWAASTVKIAARKLDRIAPAWEQRYAKPLAELRESHRALRYASLLPVLAEGSVWRADGLDLKGRPVTVHYDPMLGLFTERCDA